MLGSADTLSEMQLVFAAVFLVALAVFAAGGPAAVMAAPLVVMAAWYCVLRVAG